MKDFNYVQSSLDQNISVLEFMERECDRVLGYHSCSPQYRLYSNQFSSMMNDCLYKGFISPKDYEILTERIKNKKDVNSRNLASPIINLLSRYKPRLKIIDLLYNIDLSRTYILKLVSGEMNEVYKSVVGFSGLFDRRQSLILESIEMALNTISNPSKECYYYLFLAKTSLIVSTKYYRNGESDGLVDLYVDVSREIQKADEEFYKEFVEYYEDADIEIRDSNLFNVSESSTYSYMDYLHDFDLVFKSLAKPNSRSIVDECNKRLVNSKLPNYLKDACSRDMYNLVIKYQTEEVEMTMPFVFYDFVGKDFVYYLDIKTFNESKVVVNTFDSVLQEDNLVEFYVNKALMASLKDDGDDLTYNIVLLDSLENLQSYGFIEDVSEYFEKYRRK